VAHALEGALQLADLVIHAGLLLDVLQRATELRDLCAGLRSHLGQPLAEKQHRCDADQHQLAETKIFEQQKHGAPILAYELAGLDLDCASGRGFRGLCGLLIRGSLAAAEPAIDEAETGSPVGQIGQEAHAEAGTLASLESEVDFHDEVVS